MTDPMYKAVNGLRRSNNRLWCLVIAVSCYLCFVSSRLNAVSGQLAIQQEVTRRMKQPLTVCVYPAVQVTQKYEGLPGFKDGK